MSQMFAPAVKKSRARKLPHGLRREPGDRRSETRLYSSGLRRPPNYSPGMAASRSGQDFSRMHVGSVGARQATWTTDPDAGGETITSTCCPRYEGQSVSSEDKFSVINMGPLPDLGGTQARYRFDYIGAVGSDGDCACNCCAFVQFVKGFFELNGVRRPHTLPGSGQPLSETTFRQDSPVIAHAVCRVATAGGGPLNDTPGSLGIKSTDNVNIHLEFDARTIDTCNSNAVVASRLFTLNITGAHPRSFSATGNFG